MVVTSRPFWPSVIYVLATLVVVGLILIVPGWVGRRRIRRQARLEAQARYGVPGPWQQGSASSSSAGVGATCA